jgi:hypothetical protein
LARAYAAAVPCASACAPFKNSPGTYATCCKQHAATAAAAKPKPPAAKPAVLKSRFHAAGPVTPFQKANPLPVTKSKVQKPKTVDQLHQGQQKVKKVDDWNSPANTATQNLKHFLSGDPSSDPPSNAPSGGDVDGKSDGRCNISHHTSGCNGPSECDRLQVGKYNSDVSSDLRIRFTVQDGQGADSLTSQVGGEEHCKTCDWKGYKTYISVNGGKFGAGIEDSGPGGGDKGKPFYASFDSQEGFIRHYNMITGHTYDVRTTKQNGTKNGKPAVHLVTTITEVGGQPVTVVDIWDTGRLGHGSPFIRRQGVQGKYIDQIRIDNYPKEKGCAAVVSFG